MNTHLGVYSTKPTFNPYLPLSTGSYSGHQRLFSRYHRHIPNGQLESNNATFYFIPGPHYPHPSFLF